MKTYKFPLEPNHKNCINMPLLGWFKESTIYDISGCDWKIETYKLEGAIRCCAKIGYAPEEEGMLFIPSNHPLLRLHTDYRDCDKAAAIEVHEAGLKRFNQIVASGLIPVPQHIKAWVAHQKYRADIAKYPKTTTYTQSNTHL